MKELGELYTQISNSINRGNTNALKNLLSKSDLIDITQDGCDFLYLPIERDQPEVISVLLKYFFQKQLSRYAKDSLDYKILLKGLKENIIDWTTEYGCSEEMKQALSSYIDLYNKDNLSIITEVSDENGSSVKDDTNDLLIKDDKSYYPLSNKIKGTLIDICFDSDILSPHKKHYTKDLKINIQNLLKLNPVQEVTDFLESLKDSFALERTPSKSTLYRWKQEFSEKNYIDMKQPRLQEANKFDLTVENLQRLAESYTEDKTINELQNHGQSDFLKNKENNTNFNITNFSNMEDYIKQQDGIKVIGENISLDTNHTE